VSITITSPPRQLSDDDLEAFVERGGYVHPLFSQAGQRRPFPGQALLLVAGGLVEQTEGLPSGIIALIEFSRVTFQAMAFPPIEVFVTIDVHEPTGTRRGDRIVWPMTWRVESADALHVTAEVRMLGQQDVVSPT